MLISNALKTKENILQQKRFKWDEKRKMEIENLRSEEEYQMYISKILSNPRYQNHKELKSELEFLCSELFMLPLSYYKSFYSPDITYGFNSYITTDNLRKEEIKSIKYKVLDDDISKEFIME